MAFGTLKNDLNSTIGGVSKFSNQFGILGVSLKDIFDTVHERRGLTNIFSNVLTEKDKPMLEGFNRVLKETGDKQKALQASMIGASKAAKKLAMESGKTGVDIDKLTFSTNKSKLAMIGAKAAAIALNAALSIGLSLAIQGVTALFDHMAHAEENASEKSREAAEASAEVTASLDEEADRIDELIGKYEELANSEYIDAETREEIRDIQKEINSLVEGETTGLDLVNGKLNDQLLKLKQIRSEEAKDNLDKYVAAYHDAKKASDDAHIRDTEDATYGTKWAADLAKRDLVVSGYDEKAAAILHKTSGIYAFKDGLPWSYDTHISIAGNNAQEYVDNITEGINALVADPNYYHQGSEVYAKLVALREEYLAYTDSIDTQAEQLLNAVIKSNDYDALIGVGGVNSLESYTKYRDKLFNAVWNDTALAEAKNDGEITKGILDKYIDEWLEKELPEYYQEAATNQTLQNKKSAIIDNIRSHSEDWGRDSSANRDLSYMLDKLSDEDIDILHTLHLQGQAFDSFDAALTAIVKYKRELRDMLGDDADFVDVMSDVQSLSAGLDQIDKIYADILNKEGFDFSSLLNNENFSETFSELDSYGDFIRTITSSSDDIDACQESFNALVAEYINTSGVLNKLTDDTRDAAIAFLEQNGIVNAAEIVDNALALQKYRLALETGASTDAIYKEIEALYGEETAAAIAEQALAQFNIQKRLLINNPIDTRAEIDSLIALAKQANASAESLKELNRLRKLINMRDEKQALMEEALASGDVATAYKQKALLAELNDRIDQLASAPTIEYDFSLDYSGGDASNGNAGSTKEVDWIEVAIDRIEQSINRFKNTATSAYNSLQTRLGATKDEISAITGEITTQAKAYNRYMQAANSVGLSSDLQRLVQNGSIDIRKYDSETQEQIKNYQNWYEKAIECDEAITTLHKDLASLYEDDFNAIQKDFEKQLGLLEHSAKTYEAQADALEAKGYLESTGIYTKLQETERQNLAILQSELSALETAFASAVASGEIEEGSESWYSMQQAINDVKEQIDDANLSLIEYSNTMRDIEWGHFDYLQERISQMTSEADFLIDLMSNSYLFNDQGQLNETGNATVGLHAMNYNTYMAQADQYAEEMLRIQKDLADDPYNTKLIERREELLELQQESILAAEDEKQAIVDLVSEGIDAELESLQELIDAYTDALDSAKDLHDYQKNISDQTSNIADIRKQLAAYEGDLSEETRAKIQQLQVDLESAEEELQETEYEQYISDQKKLLDDLYTEYETLLNQRLENIDTLLSDMIAATNANAESISATLKEVAGLVGYDLSDALKDIWFGGSDDADGIVTEYGDGFDEKLTSINDVLDQIQANTAAMIAASSAEADAGTSDAGNITPPMPDVGTTPPSSDLSSPDTPDTPDNVIDIGDMIDASGAKIYERVGAPAKNQYFADDPIYTVLDEKDDYYMVRWHKSNSGVTGWFKKNDVKAFKTGGLVDYTGLAQLDGTPSKPELVLNAQDTENFLTLKDTLRKLSQQQITLQSGSNVYGNINPVAYTGLFDGAQAMKHMLSENPASNVQQSMGDINVDVHIDHVQDYNDFVNQLRSDRKFEKMIQSITIDRIAGGSSLSKNRYKW